LDWFGSHRISAGDGSDRQLVPGTDCDTVIESMTGLRRHLPWVVCGWLACQMAGLVASPVLLSQLAATEEHRECDCPVAPGQACPMHHGGTHGDTTCKMRNAFPGSNATLLSQAAVFGVLPDATAAVSTFHPGTMVRAATPDLIAHARVPEAPPPRS